MVSRMNLTWTLPPPNPTYYPASPSDLNTSASDDWNFEKSKMYFFLIQVLATIQTAQPPFLSSNESLDIGAALYTPQFSTESPETLLEIDSNDNMTILEPVESSAFGHFTSFIIILLGVILSFLTTSMNVMVLISFKIDRQLQTISNYFLLSLAVADAMIGLISIPFMTIYTLQGGWTLGYPTCMFWLSVDYLMSNASVYNLLLISFDRYFSVTRPLSYRPRRTTKKALTMIAVTYMISLVLWPPWIISWPYIEGRFAVPNNQCMVQFLMTNAPVTIGTIVAAFYLPVAIMVILYARVFYATKKRQKDFCKLQAGGQKSTTKSRSTKLETTTACSDSKCSAETTLLACGDVDSRKPSTFTLSLGEEKWYQPGRGNFWGWLDRVLGYFRKSSIGLRSPVVEGSSNCPGFDSDCSDAESVTHGLTEPAALSREPSTSRAHHTSKPTRQTSSLRSTRPKASEMLPMLSRGGVTTLTAVEDQQQQFIVQKLPETSKATEPTSKQSTGKSQDNKSDTEEHSNTTNYTIRIDMDDQLLPKSSFRKCKRPVITVVEDHSGESSPASDRDRSQTDSSHPLLPANQRRSISFQMDESNQQASDSARSTPRLGRLTSDPLTIDHRRPDRPEPKPGPKTGNGAHSADRQAKKAKRAERKQESKAAKTLSAILLAFILTWTPYSIIVCIEALAPGTVSNVLWTLSYYLCYLNSTVNPLCYALCNPNFRQTYLRILKCKWSKPRAPVVTMAGQSRTTGFVTR